MKKQSTVHRKNQPIQPETSAATFLGSARSSPQPKGLFDHDRGKPTHLDAGAAESQTRPVEMPHRSDRASARTGQSSTGSINQPSSGRTNSDATSRSGTSSGSGSSRTPR